MPSQLQLCSARARQLLQLRADALSEAVMLAAPLADARPLCCRSPTELRHYMLLQPLLQCALPAAQHQCSIPGSSTHGAQLRASSSSTHEPAAAHAPCRRSCRSTWSAD